MCTSVQKFEVSKRFVWKKLVLFKDSLNWSKVWVKKSESIYRASRTHSLLLSMQAETMNREQKQRRVHKKPPLGSVLVQESGQLNTHTENDGHFQGKQPIKYQCPGFTVKCFKGSEGFASHNTHCYHSQSAILSKIYHGNHSVCQKNTVTTVTVEPLLDLKKSGSCKTSIDASVMWLLRCSKELLGKERQSEASLFIYHIS